MAELTRKNMHRNKTGQKKSKRTCFAHAMRAALETTIPKMLTHAEYIKDELQTVNLCLVNHHKQAIMRNNKSFVLEMYVMNIVISPSIFIKNY